jgi:hypothetical protein
VCPSLEVPFLPTQPTPYSKYLPCTLTSCPHKPPWASLQLISSLPFLPNMAGKVGTSALDSSRTLERTQLQLRHHEDLVVS